MPGQVYILTTEGPVAVQSIQEEEPSVRSVICIDGRAEALPVSRAYDAFVRSPTGIVERVTGHPSYRMDVSAPIDNGRSWQLGAYLAHIAALQGGTAKPVYATGEVDRDGAVRPVEFIDRKLAAMSAPAEDGAVVLVPVSIDTVPEEIGGIPVVPVATVAEALRIAGLEVPAKRTENTVPASLSIRQNMKTLIAAIIGAIALFWLGIDPARWAALSADGRLLELEADLDGAAGIGALQANLYRRWLSFRRPDAGSIRIEGSVHAVVDGDTCGDAASTSVHPLGRPLDGYAVCGVTVRAFEITPETVVIGRLAYWPDGLGNGGRPERTLRGSAEQGGRTWEISSDEPMPSGAALRLAVVAGPVDVNGSQPWYGDLLSAPADSAAVASVEERLSRLGYVVRVVDWP